ncbi:phage integrase N-terminal SAM-like domain-containing protein [Cytobacillus purgationiresistens]|uniref:Site-specific recombinase XerD n=1 Tax=Cytobacillus purgationiresistens TaxID=863449 RepID=A0ABU0AQI6_9BACI|nr:phage integrase N-terminal SAM-like domain-containing protein [Cytobacillus purgationiresistens]MDQ0273512.1 site-specific recombinase XerD [Cytobacillus purgationiresistens]
MPFGYEEHRLSKGISPNTTYVEVKLINKMLSFIDKKHKKSVEPSEILPKDVKEFIEFERKEGIKPSTLNRKIHMIKLWFDYMWRIGKVLNDFMAKYVPDIPEKYFKEEIIINYKDLLVKKNDIINSPSLLLYSKLLFLFYIKGVRLRDLVKITTDNIHFSEYTSEITIHKKNNLKQVLIFQNDEKNIINACIARANERGTPFLMSSKKEGEYVPLQFGSTKEFVNQLKEALGMNFRSEHVRLAYIKYLYEEENKTIEDIRKIMGITIQTAAQSIQESLERIKTVEYNENNII